MSSHEKHRENCCVNRFDIASKKKSRYMTLPRPELFIRLFARLWWSRRTLHTYSRRDSIRLHRWDTKKGFHLDLSDHFSQYWSSSQPRSFPPIALIYDVSVRNENQWRSLTSNGPWLKNTIWGLAERIKKRHQGEARTRDWGKAGDGGEANDEREREETIFRFVRTRNASKTRFYSLVTD